MTGYYTNCQLFQLCMFYIDEPLQNPLIIMVSFEQTTGINLIS